MRGEEVGRGVTPEVGVNFMSSVCETWPCHFFQREESWGPPSHKKEVLCGTTKRKQVHL